MWISRILSENKAEPLPETGEVTLSSPDNWEADASKKERNINSFSPYGYAAVAPVGEEVLLLPVSNGTAALGTKTNAEGLAAGEILIRSKGGATIELKNDGTIVLNKTVIIDSEGGISPWHTS